MKMVVKTNSLTTNFDFHRLKNNRGLSYLYQQINLINLFTLPDDLRLVF